MISGVDFRRLAAHALVALLLAGWAGLTAAGGPPALVLDNHRADLDRLLTESAPAWTLRQIEIQGRGAFDFDLRPVEVFADDARVVIDDGSPLAVGSLNRTRYLRGSVRGMDHSVVAARVGPDGTITGLLNDGTVTWELQRRPWDDALEATNLREDGSPREPFRCLTDQLREPREVLELRIREQEGVSRMSVPAELPAGQLYQVTVAIETDFELYNRFGNTESTLEYIGNLFNYISAIYEQETQTRLLVGDTFLWTSAASQPWVETGTWCRLAEFGLYWRNNRAGVGRTIAHFLSGQSLGGGIAWMDVLCRPPTQMNHPTGCTSVGNQYVWGGFGVSAGLNGTISTPGGLAWDALVVAHEIGHNFNSPHTHCYGGFENNASPVDACWNQETPESPSCWSGSVSLPGMDSLDGGSAGQRQGTIMSYCHTRPGGVTNVAGTLGRNHPFGVAADRVPNRMFTNVQTRAAANPACIPIILGSDTNTLTVSRTGSGTGIVVSEPAGIDCGDVCSADFNSETEVVLTATADTDSEFVGWSGGGCSGSGSCTVTMNSAQFVTATFNPAPVELENGVSVPGLSGAQDQQRFFFINVPEGATNLLVTISGGTGDANLYLRFGAPPTLNDWDCRPWLPGNNESCPVDAPEAGTYHIMLVGSSSYNNVTLSASFTPPPATGCGYDNEVLLSDATLTGTVTHGACSILRAGPALSVATAADVTFVAGERVVLRPGFRVEAGAMFRALIDPALQP